MTIVGSLLLEVANTTTSVWQESPQSQVTRQKALTAPPCTATYMNSSPESTASSVSLALLSGKEPSSV